MDLNFSKEDLEFRDEVRAFLENEYPKHIREKMHNGEELTRDEVVEWHKCVAKKGWMGHSWPVEHGGTGWDATKVYLYLRELALEGCPTFVPFGLQMVAPVIWTFGSEEQKKKFLPDLATGKKIGAFGLTEPNAGSDAGNTQTRAVLNEDEYIVNGEKSFCTNAGQSSVLIFTALIIEDGKEKGISAFVIDTNTDGLSFNPPEKKMGWCGSDTRSVFFKDMHIPKSAILGKPSKGFKQFLKTLTGGRITIGALGLGTAQGAFKRALEYSQEREAFGKLIHKFQGISFKLSDMATQIEAARHMVYYAAWKKDNDLPVIREAAMAKLFASETAMKVTTEAIQVLGGFGYIKEYDVERFFRDAKILEIGEGTSEVQRMIIARELINSVKSI